jgi:hypothetical protein
MTAQTCKSNHFPRSMTVIITNNNNRNDNNRFLQREHLICRKSSKAGKTASSSSSSSSASSAAEKVVEVNERAKHWFTADAYYDRAETLYEMFQENQRGNFVKETKFVFDYWHVEDQYAQLRTPAKDYFDLLERSTNNNNNNNNNAFEEFERSLLKYAKERLGLSNFTPIWLSAYVDGMSQELHTDIPNGPLAFVFSLTKEPRAFTGGQTTIFNPERLQNYWQRFNSEEIVQREQLFIDIDPIFNRLTIFDPRLPHGVREVKGTKDVSKGRIVLNGWFNEPAISCVGSLSLDDDEDVRRILDNKLDELYEELETLPAMIGFASLILSISNAGLVDSIEWGCDTVVPQDALESDDITEARDSVLSTCAGMLSECVFPKKTDKSSICIPFQFS